MKPTIRRFASALLGHPIAVLVAVAVITAISAVGIPRIRADFTLWSFLDARDGELDRLRAFDRVFGDDTLVVVLVLEARDVFAPGALATIDDLTRALADLDAVERVRSLTTVGDIRSAPGGIALGPLVPRVPLEPAAAAVARRRAFENSILRGRMVSKGDTATTILARLRPDLTDVVAREPVVQRIRAIARDHEIPGEVRIHVTGHPEIEQVYLELGQTERALVTGLALTSVVVLAFVLYRNVWAVLLPALAMGIVVIWTLGMMGFTGGRLDILSAAIPALIVVIGVADALHLISRYIEQLRAGEAKLQALEHALTELATACLLTSVTTAIGFASMVVADLAALRAFGTYTAAGVMLAYVVTITFIPALLALVPAPRTAPSRQRDGWDRLFAGLAGTVTSRPGAVVLVTSALVVVAGALATRLEVRTRALEEIDEVHPLSVATHASERSMQGVLNLEIDLRTQVPGGALDPRFLDAMATLQRRLDDDPMVTGSLSVVDLLRELNLALHEGDPAAFAVPITSRLASQLLFLYGLGDRAEDVDRAITADHGRTHISVRLRDLGSDRFFALVESLEPMLEETFRGLATWELTGDSIVANHGIRRVVQSVMSSLGLAFGCILLSMTLLFRSIRVGLISMLPNIGPVAVVLAAMAVTGVPLRMATSMICAVALGIAVDTTIHVLVRLRRELARSGGDYAVAVRAALIGTGRPILFTTIVLSVGFSMMAVASFKAWVHFGLLGALAIVVSLWVGLAFTPAIVILMHPRLGTDHLPAEVGQPAAGAGQEGGP